jgi:hypothetical protein
MLDPPSPATIVATIPEWLARRPVAGETILVGFAEYDDARCVTITLDPDRDPTDEVAALRQAVVDGATDLAIVAVTGSESPALEQTLRFLALGAERFGMNVLGVLVIVPPQRGSRGYWRGLPVPTEYRLPPSYARPTEETS